MLRTGPRVVKNWSKSFFSLFFPEFYSVLGVCLKTQIVSVCVKIVFSQNCRDVKSEVFENKISFFVLVFLMLLQDKQTWKKAPKTYKCFLRGHPKMRKKVKNGFLEKKTPTLIVSGRETNAHFSCTPTVLANFLGEPSNENKENQEKLWSQRKLPKNF